MIKELSKIEFKRTFGNKMIDLTKDSLSVINIWPYVNKLAEENLIDKFICERKLVELVYRNDLGTFDHVLLPTVKSNYFMVIIVNLIARKVEGHYELNLNIEYGIE